MYELAAPLEVLTPHPGPLPVEGRGRSHVAAHSQIVTIWVTCTQLSTLMLVRVRRRVAAGLDVGEEVEDLFLGQHVQQAKRHLG